MSLHSVPLRHNLNSSRRITPGSNRGNVRRQVQAQKDALSSELYAWASTFDFVRPEPPSHLDESGKDRDGNLREDVPIDDDHLEALTVEQVSLMKGGLERTFGRAWELSPPKCCNMLTCKSRVSTCIDHCITSAVLVVSRD